jgi:hypothetical protein
MSEIMPKRVKGTHAFRASQQSHGAALSMPAPLSKGKGKEEREGEGEERGKGKGKETEIDLELNDNSDNDNDKPAIILPPSVPAGTITSSTSASISAASSSKRKYSALDDDDSVLSSSLNSSSKKLKSCSGATAIDGVKASLETISSSIRDMTAKRKLRQLQQEACADAQAAQAAQLLQTSVSSPQRRHEAMQHLQQSETYLDPDRMIALIDLVSSDTIAADVYMTLEREDYHKAWISKWLRELSFIEGITVDM